MNTLLKRLRSLLAGDPQNVSSKAAVSDAGAIKQPAADSAALDDSSLARLMQLIDQTEEGQYGCEETLDLLDEYAELVVSDQNAATLMPLVKGHIEHCVDCTERYEALVRILESS